MKSASASKKRIAEIDALRGFALFGILLVNIFVFHAPYAHYFEFYSQFSGEEAAAMQIAISLSVGKFMFIFAFLFGYGAWMQYEKYEDKKAFQSFWWRRMSWLALFGALHILFFSYGDILLPYALLGMTLPWLMNRQDRWLWILFLLIHLIPIYEFALRQVWEYSSIFTTSIYPLEEHLQINSTGTWWEIFKMRCYDYQSLLTEKSIIYIPKEWSLFVFGILAARKNLVRRLSLRHGLLFCITALLLLWLWTNYRPEVIGFFQHDGSFFRAFLLGILIISADFLHGLLYIIGFWLLWRWSFFRSFFDWLRYIGKMSLTNYLLQSLICTTIFYGYGLGWYGNCTPRELIGLTLAIFAGQLLFSYCWLQYFSFGPMEAFWRKQSYAAGIFSENNKKS